MKPMNKSNLRTTHSQTKAIRVFIGKRPLQKSPNESFSVKILLLVENVLSFHALTID